MQKNIKLTLERFYINNNDQYIYLYRKYIRNFRKDYFDAQKGDLMIYRKTREFQESYLFVIFLLRPLEFFTHMETLLLPVKGFIF